MMSAVSDIENSYFGLVEVSYDVQKSIQSLTDQQIKGIAAKLLEILAREISIFKLCNKIEGHIHISKAPMIVDGELIMEFTRMSDLTLRVRRTPSRPKGIFSCFQQIKYKRKLSKLREEERKENAKIEKDIAELRNELIGDQKVIPLPISTISILIKQLLTFNSKYAEFFYRFGHEISGSVRFEVKTGDKIRCVFENTCRDIPSEEYDLGELTKWYEELAANQDHLDFQERVTNNLDYRVRINAHVWN
ncbi:MAG: hypothetical protein ACHQUC_02000 [Chlamydiales bacterium]